MKKLIPFSVLALLALVSCGSSGGQSSTSAPVFTSDVSSSQTTTSSDAPAPSSSEGETTSSSQTSEKTSATQSTSSTPSSSSPSETSSSEGPTSSDTAVPTSSIPSSSESSSSSEEDPDDPDIQKIQIDLSSPAKTYSHARFSEEDVRALLKKVFRIDDDDIDYAEETMDFLTLFNAMGFTLQELNEIADFIVYLTETHEGTPAEITDEAFRKLQSIMEFFEGDKFALNGLDQIEIKNLGIAFGGGGSAKPYYPYSTSYRRALEELPDTSAIKQRYQDAEKKNQKNEATTIVLKSDDLLSSGRLVEAFLKSLLANGPDFVKALLGNALAGVAGFGPEWKEYLNDLSFITRDPTKIYDGLKAALRGLRASESDCMKIFELLCTNALQWSRVSLSNSGVIQSMDIIAAIERFYKDNIEFISGTEIRALFRFIIALYANMDFSKGTAYGQITPATGQEMMEEYARTYDAAYGSLRAEDKAALKSLAKTAGLDYDDAIASLRALTKFSPIGEGWSQIAQGLSDVVAPVVSKYKGDFDGFISIRNIGGQIGFLEGESVTKDVLLTHLQNNCTCYENSYDGGKYVGLAEVKLSAPIDTSKPGACATTVYVRVEGENDFHEVSIHYTVYPKTYASPLPFEATSIADRDNSQGILIDVTQAKYQAKLTKEYNIGFAYDVYSDSAHKLIQSTGVATYRLDKMDLSLGIHWTELDATVEGKNVKVPMRYVVYDPQNIVTKATSFGAYSAKSSDGRSHYDWDSNTVVYLDDINGYGVSTVSARMVDYYQIGDTLIAKRDSERTETITLPAPVKSGTVRDIKFSDGSKIDLAVYSWSELEKEIHLYGNYFISLESVYVLEKGSQFELSGAEVYAYVTVGSYRYYDYFKIPKDRCTTPAFDTSVASSEIKKATFQIGGITTEVEYMVFDPADADYEIYAEGIVGEPFGDVTLYELVTIEVRGVTYRSSTDRRDLDLSSVLEEGGIDTSTVGREEKAFVSQTLGGRSVTVFSTVHGLDELVFEKSGKGERTFYVDNYIYGYADGSIRLGDHHYGLYLDSAEQAEVVNLFKDVETGSAVYTFKKAILGHVFEIPLTVYKYSRSVTKPIIREGTVAYVAQGEATASVSVTICLYAGDHVNPDIDSMTVELPISIDSSKLGEQTIVNPVYEYAGGSMVIEGSFTLRVLEPSAIKTGTFVDEPTVYEYNNNVSFALYEIRTITYKGQTFTVQRTLASSSVYIGDDKDAHTPGRHSVTVDFQSYGQRECYYWAIDYGPSPQAYDWNDYGLIYGGRLDVEGTNTFDVEKADCLSSAQIRFEVSKGYDSRISPSGGYYYDETKSFNVALNDPELELLTDLTKATQGYSTGFAIYKGALISFSYCAYESSKVTGARQVVLPNQQNFVLERVQQNGGFELSGTWNKVADYYGIEIVLETHRYSEYVSLYDQTITSGEFTRTLLDYEGNEVNVAYGIYSIADPEHFQIENLYPNTNRCFEVGENVHVYLDISYRDLTTGQYNYIYFEAPEDILALFDTSTSSGGEYRTATIELGGFTYQAQYLVYEESELQLEFEENSYTYVAGFVPEGSIYITAAYYVVDSNGEKVTVRGQSYCVQFDEDLSALTAGEHDVTGKVEIDGVIHNVTVHITLVDPADVNWEKDGSRAEAATNYILEGDTTLPLSYVTLDGYVQDASGNYRSFYYQIYFQEGEYPEGVLSYKNGSYYVTYNGITFRLSSWINVVSEPQIIINGTTAVNGGTIELTLPQGETYCTVGVEALGDLSGSFLFYFAEMETTFYIYQYDSFYLSAGTYTVTITNPDLPNWSMTVTIVIASE